MKSATFRSHLRQGPTRLRLGGFFAGVIVAVLCSFIAPAKVRADLADQHYKRAMQAYEGKDYPTAIREFQAAYKVRQLPRILLNIGQVYRKLGMASSALKFYEHYLRVEPHPKAEVKAEVDRYIAQTRAMLDPPEFVAVETKSASAVAAEMVASAPSNVTPVTVPEYDPADEEQPGRGGRRGARGARQNAVLMPPTLDPPPYYGSPAATPGSRPGLTLLPGQNPGQLQTNPQPPPKQDTPFYKKGWFWGVIGGFAAGAIITGVAVGVTRREDAPATILYPVK